MEEVFAKLPESIKLVAEIIGVVCLVATVVVHITPNPDDDGKIKKFTDVIFKVINYLPTLGINPRTKKLEESVKEYQKEELKK